MIPESIREAIHPFTGLIKHTAVVGGGCIANATRIQAEKGIFFLKWAEGEAGRTFEAEADGLRALAKAAAETEIGVPEALAKSNANGDSGFLFMEWIEPGHPDGPAWRAFGAALAEMHRVEVPSGENGPYGYAHDNWIGSKPQRNGWAESWPAFFGEQRLCAQAERVLQRGEWQSKWDAPLDRLVARLGEFLPQTPKPSLLHGDLWAGNAIATIDGRFALIDPAVYVGHREADLAMTELFGGFAPEFYEGYSEAWPLDPGYPERREIYQLFHLINHLTHGPGYASRVERVLERFATA